MICSKCGWWERLCHCKDLELFNTSKDKLWEFIDYRNFRVPVEVRSKGHWKSLLKEHGLVDDVKGWKEPEQPKLDKRFIANEINRELQDKGLREKVWKRR